MPIKTQGKKCGGITRTGDRCTRWAVKGSDHCVWHGGSAPQLNEKAFTNVQNAQLETIERLRILVPKAVDAVKAILEDNDARPSDRIKAAELVLDRFVARKMHTADDENTEERDIDEEIDRIIAEQQETG